MSISEFCLRDADALGEQAQARRRVSRAGARPQRRHARIVPAVDEAFLHERHQLALAHHRVVEVRARELDLAGLAASLGSRLASSGASSSGECAQVDLVDAPVVQRAVVLELQRAQRMRDALDRIATAQCA